jgi:hypothetical protein
MKINSKLPKCSLSFPKILVSYFVSLLIIFTLNFKQNLSFRLVKDNKIESNMNLKENSTHRRHSKKSNTDLLVANKNNSTDPLSLLSNEELEKILNKYDSKNNTGSNQPKAFKDDLFGFETNQDPISNLLDINSHSVQGKEESMINSIISDNKNAIRKFKLNEKEAYNLVRILKDRKFFNKLPTSARNLISVRFL